jgi:hypothetical protein
MTEVRERDPRPPGTNDVQERALFAYVFVPIEGCAPAIERAWAAVGRLGITAPIDDLDVGAVPDGAAFPTEPVPAFRLLAAATRPDEPGQYQAYAFAQHDVAGVVACLMPGEGSDGAWPSLLAEWTAADPVAEESRVLGTAMVLIGLSSDAVAEPSEVDGRPWAFGVRTDRGVAVWEATGSPRLMAMVCAREREEDVHRWAWWEAETRLPAFARYLLHASKVRFEGDVFQAEMPELHRAQRAMEEEIVDVTRVLAEEERRPHTAEHLYAAERRLIALESSLAGAAGSGTDLDDLRRTVGIARENMKNLMPGTARGETGDSSPFADDLALADWLDAQIAHEIGYASSTRARADGVRNLLSLRLRHAAERRLQEQNYLLLLQTALLSALIAGGGAYTALKDSGVTPGLHAPLTALAVTLALALPLLFVHWYARYRSFDRIAAGLLGASVGWFIASDIWRHGGTGAHPQQTIPAAILFGALGMALTWLQDRWVKDHRTDAAPTTGP